LELANDNRIRLDGDIDDFAVIESRPYAAEGIILSDSGASQSIFFIQQC
jgi:hypothetical protein